MELENQQAGSSNGHAADAVREHYRGAPDPKDAAKFFATDAGWREEFKLALEEQRQDIHNKRALAIAEADEALAAIGDRYPIEPAGAPPPAKLTRKELAPARKFVASKEGKETIALTAIKLAGKDGIAARTLGKELGTTAGPVVAPLLKDKRIRQKGTAGATRYYAV